MNIALFGGSFNPVHNGHIALMRRMKREFALDKIIIMPTFVTPLKDNSFMASAKDRYQMCSLAFEDEEGITVSNWEISRKTKSFTVDTLGYLKETCPEDNIFLITGADAFLQLPLWHRFEEIFDIATILTVSRDSDGADILKEAGERYRAQFGCRYKISENVVSNLSSTFVRDKISKGLDVGEDVPYTVYEYIKKKGLYGYQSSESL